ncbi:hypothetical protein [Nocardia farcinica]|uniref:hypothetical protein n=1 Tax=Nocardia farcinica TaxID=37329 RepID=UPI00245615D5|nr:hypothetical protein [Nocardia farcinica]
MEDSSSSPAVPLRPRLSRSRGKRPFSTQIQPSTLWRLEWIRRNGYSITDTVDDAINAYLDAAGVPREDTADADHQKGAR